MSPSGTYLLCLSQRHTICPLLALTAPELGVHGSTVPVPRHTRDLAGGPRFRIAPVPVCHSNKLVCPFCRAHPPSGVSPSGTDLLCLSQRHTRDIAGGPRFRVAPVPVYPCPRLSQFFASKVVCPLCRVLPLACPHLVRTYFACPRDIAGGPRFRVAPVPVYPLAPSIP